MSLITMLGEIWKFFGLEMNLYGYTFSFEQLFLYTLFAGLIVWVVANLLF